jgi:uncharacterized protein YdeI (YjbR/CyaY-like superfamily)
MSTKDKRIDAYIARKADFAKPILNHLRKVVHEACPDVVETIKWGQPHFDYKGMMCGMGAFKEHCVFGFWLGKYMKDFDKKLSPVGKTAMGNFGRIKSLKDLPSDATIKKYVKEACRLNDEGIKLSRPKATEPRKSLVVPPYLKKALAKNALAREYFDGFSYSKKKDYVDWLTEAKTEETREKRLATTIKQLSEGKGRNWKYER